MPARLTTISEGKSKDFTSDIRPNVTNPWRHLSLLQGVVGSMSISVLTAQRGSQNKEVHFGVPLCFSLFFMVQANAVSAHTALRILFLIATIDKHIIICYNNYRTNQQKYKIIQYTGCTGGSDEKNCIDLCRNLCAFF